LNFPALEATCERQSQAPPIALPLDIGPRFGNLGPVSDLFLLSGALPRDPSVEAWFSKPDDELRRLALPWFEQMRGCGADVRELVHDGYPVACLGNAAFAYVNAFTAHVNVGFFHGSALDDPAGLLEGTGKRMRHVKVRWGQPVNEAALNDLITSAYRDIRTRVEAA
jgi:Domain of unknown function (DU1801)